MTLSYAYLTRVTDPSEIPPNATDDFVIDDFRRVIGASTLRADDLPAVISSI
jgi:hypothetical protein